MSCAILVIPPFAAVVFLAVLAAILWPWQYCSSVDKGKDTELHSERAYKSFEFFVTVTLAIVAGIGYVRLDRFKGNEIVARQAMIGLGAIALIVATSLSLFVVIHQGSKLRRWETVEWSKLPFWLEFWMCIVMASVGTAIWIVTNLW